MHRFALPASISLLAMAILVQQLVPTARAEAPPSVECEEGFRTPVGINRSKVQEWIAAQHAAGRKNFLPFGVQGNTGMICAW